MAESLAEETPAAEPFRVRVHSTDGTVVVAVAGELDMLGSEDFWTTAEAAVVTSGGGTLVVDLTKVVFLDSHGLAALHRVADAARRHDATLRVVVGRGRPARRAIELTGLHHVLPLCESLDQAVGLNRP